MPVALGDQQAGKLDVLAHEDALDFGEELKAWIGPNLPLVASGYFGLPDGNFQLYGFLQEYLPFEGKQELLFEPEVGLHFRELRHSEGWNWHFFVDSGELDWLS